MDTFERAFALVVGIEAGYVNDPNDPGGETKYGISKRSYPHLYIAT
ncbi:MAG TPA: glycosyl hydrolase 108 family protein [Trinickia sp.]